MGKRDGRQDSVKDDVYALIVGIGVSQLNAMTRSEDDLDVTFS